LLPAGAEAKWLTKTPESFLRNIPFVENQEFSFDLSEESELISRTGFVAGASS
jgi:hypothetical protein